jgi:hypothetical protein
MLDSWIWSEILERERERDFFIRVGDKRKRERKRLGK